MNVHGRGDLLIVLLLVAVVGYFAWQNGNNSGYSAATINAQTGG